MSEIKNTQPFNVANYDYEQSKMYSKPIITLLNNEAKEIQHPEILRKAWPFDMTSEDEYSRNKFGSRQFIPQKEESPLVSTNHSTFQKQNKGLFANTSTEFEESQ